jgi:hypothetical protein
MKLKKLIYISLIALCALCIQGCNAFESMDRSLDARDLDTLVEHGNHKLSAAQYEHALDLFERASEKGITDEVLRGLGASYGGLAGFNMFSILDSLQNATTDANSAAVFFKASAQITDFDALSKGLIHLNSIVEPNNQDYLLRSLMGSCGAAMLLYQRFDTYTNKKLENTDQITFTINEQAQGTWEALYGRLSSSADHLSLEKAYQELAVALEGRGTTKTTMTPFQNIINTGLYTDANFKTIGATEKFATLLQLANLAYLGADEALFKQHIMSLDDGAE